MTATIGHSSIVIAFIAALIGIMSPIVAARLAGDRFRMVAGYAILGQFVFVTVAAVALIYGLVATDFSIRRCRVSSVLAPTIWSTCQDLLL